MSLSKKLILPFDLGQGIVYFDKEEKVSAPEILGSASVMVASVAGIDIMSGITVLFGGQSSGKSVLTNDLVTAGVAYVPWGEPEVLPAGHGKPIDGLPSVLVDSIETALNEADVAVVDSLRRYIIGGSGTQRGGISGTYITSALTMINNIMRQEGKGLVVVINPQAPQESEAYSFARDAIAGSVETLYELVGGVTSLYRSRSLNFTPPVENRDWVKSPLSTGENIFDADLASEQGHRGINDLPDFRPQPFVAD